MWSVVYPSAVKKESEVCPKAEVPGPPISVPSRERVPVFDRRIEPESDSADAA